MLVVVGVGCGSSLHLGAVTPVKLPPPTSCKPSPVLPRLDPGFAPTLSGGVTLVSANGDARLSTAGALLEAWSADSTQVAVTDHRSLVVWRASDGALLDQISCPGPEIGANEVAMSADLRWIAVSGIQRATGNQPPVTCIADRTAHEARVVDGATAAMTFHGATLVGFDRSIDLMTGAVTLHAPTEPPPPPTAPAGVIATEGAEEFAVSHDGRHVAGWTRHRMSLSEDDTGGVPPSLPPPFLAVWDRTTGERVWRDDKRCCWGWKFSPDDRFLEGGEGRKELLRVATGEALTFPGVLRDVAPDGKRVLMYGKRGIELWSIEPQRLVFEVPRPRTIVARSRDGAIVAANDGDQLVIERSGRCTALAAWGSAHDSLGFSPDGRELHAWVSGLYTGGWARDGRRRLQVFKSMFALWRTDTGALESSLDVPWSKQVYPMMSVGRVGFGFEDGIRLYDARTARLVTLVEPPGVGQSAPAANGSTRTVRTFDGEESDTLTAPVAAFGDGRHLVGSSTAAQVSIWDLQDPRRVLDLPSVPNAGWLEELALAPDEQHLAVGMRNGVIALWTRDGKRVPMTVMHDEAVEQLAFSRDGRMLASAGREGAVLITDAASGSSIGRIALAADRATLLWWGDGGRLVINTARRFEITVAVEPPR